MKASEYKKLASEKQVVEELLLPSGAVFKMRVAPIQQWVTTGVLPASLTAKMQKASQTKEKDAVNEYVLRHFTEQDFIDSQKVGKRMLEYCAVEPKVVINTEPGTELPDDAITPEDILPEDFEAIMKWIWAGGKQGESLASFRDAQG
jgi:hypothetical protein